MGKLRLPLHKVSDLIRTGEVSPVDVVDESLVAIAQHNAELNAFRLVLDDEARQQAAEAEAEIAGGHYRGPLHGVPVAVKDLMDMQGTSTAAGSTVLADQIVDTDSPAVSLLKAAGAIIVGKTHMPEFARSGASINQHYGPVRNPWNLEHDTGGSSSGSGSAVAAGLVYGATGSDTGGSIRIPSAFCGLAGIKPTYGLVSTAGAQPLSWSLDHVGPMTRTVLDAAIMLEAMAGKPAGFYSNPAARGVDGLRVGRVAVEDELTPAVEQALDDSVDALRTAGAEIVDLSLPELRDLGTVNATILNLEAAACYRPYLREQYDEVSAVGRSRLLAAWAHGPLDYITAQQLRAKLRQVVSEKMQNLDLLALPATPHEAPLLADERENGRLCGPFNSLGWPAMSVPIDLGEHGLPVTVQLVAWPWQDLTVLQAAHAIERHGPWQGRVAPPLAD